MDRKQNRNQPPDHQARGRTRYPALAVCALLLLAVGLVFGQTVRYQFVNFDDNKNVYENPPVSRGLTAAGVAWAFSRSHASNWHPLTWISLILDCQVYGLNAGGHHLTNVLLHAAAAVLLFSVLWRSSGSFWPSAGVAAVFAVHPLRAESVAWVTERKDVLSGLFFMLTLGAYVGYVRHRFSLLRYLAVMVFFALGLMAKSMLVTLPLVLLLLDYWPLERMAFADGEHAPALHGRRSGRFLLFARLVLEKVPLLALVAISCLLTIWAQREAVVSMERLPLWWRIGNAPISYVAYLGQFFYPAGLAVLYPRAGLDLPLWKVFGASLVLLGITGAAFVGRRRCPYVFVGWLWFLGMLVPVIGLVQVGTAAMADRFTYLPQIGLGIALAWAVADGCRSSARRRWVCSVASMVLLAVLMGCAWRQTCFWRDSETLWAHTVASTGQNEPARLQLGLVLADRGKVDEAIAQYRKVLETRPLFVLARCNLGTALARKGRLDEAIAQYQKALEISPDSALAHNNLGLALAGRGHLDQAIAHCQKALRIEPDYAEAHNNLGILLASGGQPEKAIACFQRALEIKPEYAAAHNNLGLALVRHGQVDQAFRYYHESLRLRPDQPDILRNLAWIRATHPDPRFRDGVQAVAAAERAVKLSRNEVHALDALAAAYAEAGRFPEALATARKALDFAVQQHDQPLASALQARIALYESGKPYRQTLSSPSALLPPKP